MCEPWVGCWMKPFDLVARVTGTLVETYIAAVAISSEDKTYRGAVSRAGDD
jgi:hypothetical protein